MKDSESSWGRDPSKRGACGEKQTHTVGTTVTLDVPAALSIPAKRRFGIAPSHPSLFSLPLQS
eukprot:scaffold107_cov154-Amphora_coffeaeformis.AAC.5